MPWSSLFVIFLKSFSPQEAHYELSPDWIQLSSFVGEPPRKVQQKQIGEPASPGPAASAWVAHFVKGDTTVYH